MECQPWADVWLISSEAEALEEAAPSIPWQQLRLSHRVLVRAAGRARCPQPVSSVLELQVHSGDN